MSEVFTSVIANSLKLTLDTIVDDDMGDIRSKLVMPKYFDEGNMKDNFVDDLEYAGPGLASEKPEGQTMAIGTIREGVLTRYQSHTFALQLIITEEAMEDAKYDEVLSAAERLNRAMWKTVEFDAANQLIRAFNTSFVIGDGLPLASASHTLPNGGTFSNIMATPMSPSRMALQIATTQLMKYPGHDGLPEGRNPKCVVCPVDQWFAWKGILGSSYAPEPGAFNEINVLNRDYDIDIVKVVYWTNTTTNWIVLTDNDEGLSWKWRRRPRGRSWVENDNTVMKYGITARWARNCSDPRAVLAVNA